MIDILCCIFCLVAIPAVIFLRIRTNEGNQSR